MRKPDQRSSLRLLRVALVTLALTASGPLGRPRRCVRRYRVGSSDIPLCNPAHPDLGAGLSAGLPWDL